MTSAVRNALFASLIVSVLAVIVVWLSWITSFGPSESQVQIDLAAFLEVKSPQESHGLKIGKMTTIDGWSDGAEFKAQFSINPNVTFVQGSGPLTGNTYTAGANYTGGEVELSYSLKQGDTWQLVSSTLTEKPTAK